MARIRESELARLNRKIDLVALVRSSGVELRRHGSDWMGLCPFHDDADPSLLITPSEGVWKCLGACGRGGSVIDWVMARDGVSFRHAVALLQTGGDEPLEAELDLEPAASDPELLGAVADFYHETLKRSAEGVEYLKSRGLDSVELIDEFGLGLANRTLGYRLPHGRLKAGRAIRGRLQELGVLRKSGHEHLSGSLVVPIRGELGEVVQLYGRKLRDNLRAGTPLHLYLPGPHRGIWNWTALREHTELIVCESLLDAMTFWAAGYRNVTTTYGANGFTAELEGALKAHTKRVLLAFDRDAAGDGAAKSVAERLTAEGLECYRVLFPRGMDANAYALEVQPATKSLGLVIRAAQWLGSGPPPEGAEGNEGLSVGQSGVATDVPGALPFLTAEGSVAPDPSADPERTSVPAASPVPEPASEPRVPLVEREREVHAMLEDRSYRVRGLERNSSPELLRVNLLVRREGSVHVDTLDLYQARQRAAFVKQAAVELGVGPKVLKHDLGRLLLVLERLRDERIRKALAPDEEAPDLTESEKREALELLRDPRLLERILTDFERVGLVGEETNKLVGYLAAVSRKLEDPLAVIVQSSSAAGKTSLMDAVLAFVPDEERVQYSALTGQSLFYMQDKNLAHKILAVVEEEGAERASYALKLLQSEGELTIASTGKDPETGKLVAHEYRVVGPVMIILTTTAVEVDEELFNRAIVLAVDEDRAQTRRVHRIQRERRTLEGLLARRAKAELVRLHQNAQRLLRPLAVVNPYAPRLTFLDTRTRTRRDHEKYLTLMDAVALLHQHQRPVRRIERAGTVVEYVEVEPSDIEIANRLAGEVLGRSLDELPPQTRRVLTLLDGWVSAECDELACDRGDFRFTTREVREALEVGQTQAKVHLARLVDLEYLLVHRPGSGRPHVYELLYQGEGTDGESFLPGLLDPAELADRYDAQWSGLQAQRPGPNGQQPGGGRPLAGAQPGRSRGHPAARNRLGDNDERGVVDAAPLTASSEGDDASHVPTGRNGAAP